MIYVMDPELLSLIKQNLAVSRETLDIMKKMQRAQWWANFFRLIYWFLIIGISVGLYYYLKEPLQQVFGVYASFLDRFETLQAGAESIPDVSSFKALLEKFKQ